MAKEDCDKKWTKSAKRALFLAFLFKNRAEMVAMVDNKPLFSLLINRISGHGRCLMRGFILTFLAFFLVSAWSEEPLSPQGVVFVHGKGTKSLAHDLNEVSRYWGDLVRVATRDHSIPSAMAHYDGTSHFKAVAQSVAAQIKEFIEQHQIQENGLRIVSHSYGGVVMRYIFSDPTIPGHAEIVKAASWVITMGTPHLGSEAADLAYQWKHTGNYFQRSVAAKMIPDNDSTWSLLTGDMKLLAESCVLLGTAGCPALPKPFYLVSGGHSSNILNDYYLTGHKKDALLSFLSSLVDYPDVDDGLVTQSSSEALEVNSEVILRSIANHHHLRDDDYVPMGSFLALQIFHG